MKNTAKNAVSNGVVIGLDHAKTIFNAIPKIMAEVGAIEKTRTNTQGSGYKFRGIDDVYAALHPVLVKNNVFFVPSVLESIREERISKAGGNLIYTILKVKYTFYAEDGSSFECITAGEAMDSGDKSCNKAMSAALKYALFQVFCIPTEEEKDTEYNTPEVLPKAVAKTTPKTLTNAPQATKPVNAGEWAFAFGQWKGRTCQDLYEDMGVGPQGLASYVTYLESTDSAEKPLSANARKAVAEVTNFLGRIENLSINPSQDDLPF